MSIFGLDISGYQEYDWKFIDWPALKADPLNFRFIWIKCQEGSLLPADAGSYPLDVVKRQVAGAKSVGFEAINLYHFYWYQLQQNVGGVWKWVPLDPKAQARAFYETYLLSGCEIRHPMTDIEDPLVGQFLTWYDTPTANAALAFARKLNASLQDYHAEIYRLFGVRPDIYTGKWWLDPWNKIMRSNGYDSELAWMDDHRWILADYDGELSVPSYIPLDNVIAWQRTSTPVPPVQGIPTGHVVPGDALDIDRWMLSDAEFQAWAQGGETPPVTPPVEPTDLERTVAALDAWARSFPTYPGV